MAASSAGRCSWIIARIVLATGNGHETIPNAPTTALHVRLTTNRCSTRIRMAEHSDCMLRTATSGAVAWPGGGRGFGVLRIGAPRHELTVLRQRGVNQLVEDVVGRVADEAR